MKFLIVDDSRAVQTIIRKAIEKSGLPDLEFKTASSADTAYEIAKEWQPNLLITDWHMPNMSGLELIQLLRQTGLGHIPVGMVTAEQSNIKIAEAKQNGALFVISKPCEEKELLDAIYTVIKKPAHSEPSEKTQTWISKLANTKLQNAMSSSEVHMPPEPNLEILKLSAFQKLVNEQLGESIRINPLVRKPTNEMKGVFLVVLYGDCPESGIKAISIFDKKAVNLIGGYTAKISINEIMALNKLEEIDRNIATSSMEFVTKNLDLLFVPTSQTKKDESLKVLSKSIVNNLSNKLLQTIDSAESRYDFLISQIDFGSCYTSLIII
jgi:CheY-like chemotaxis protein